jgi:hypothetical protein
MDGLNASRLSVYGEYSGFGKRFEYCICFHKVSVARRTRMTDHLNKEEIR